MSDITSSVLSNRSGISSGISKFYLLRVWAHLYLVWLWGWDHWYSLIGCGGGWLDGVARLGISGKHRYSWLSGTGSSDTTGSSRATVRRSSSSSESPSNVGRGISLKAKYQQTSFLNGRLWGCLGLKSELSTGLW